MAQKYDQKELLSEIRTLENIYKNFNEASQILVQVLQKTQSAKVRAILSSPDITQKMYNMTKELEIANAKMMTVTNTARYLQKIFQGSGKL